jgi:hypothetical protein
MFWLLTPKQAVFRITTFAMAQFTRSTPRLSPVKGKALLLDFDGADMSSAAGLMLLREIERRDGLAGVLASCVTDLRDPSRVQHSLEDIIRFRIMMIAAGYENGNDAAELRHDASFKRKHPAKAAIRRLGGCPRISSSREAGPAPAMRSCTATGRGRRPARPEGRYRSSSR